LPFVVAAAFDRSAINGFRLARYADAKRALEDFGGSVPVVTRPDYTKVKPASKEVFEVYKVLYAYDKKPLATSPRDGALFLTSQTTDNRSATVASTDEGATWHLVSRTDALDDHLYAIGGQRHLTPDGWLLGSFTHDSLKPAEAPSAVRFFQLCGRCRK
jgi:hypothetical protein